MRKISNRLYRLLISYHIKSCAYTWMSWTCLQSWHNENWYHYGD